MTQKQQIIVNVRLKLAALRSYIQDRGQELTVDEIDDFLDEILLYEKLIKELEK